MRTIQNFDEALQYVNRLGIVSPFKPISWRQSDFCKIILKLEEESAHDKFVSAHIAPKIISSSEIKWPSPKIYPLKVHFHRKLSRARHKLIFTVNGKQIEFAYPR